MRDSFKFEGMTKDTRFLARMTKTPDGEVRGFMGVISNLTVSN